jgi:hypothetical protein
VRNVVPALAEMGFAGICCVCDAGLFAATARGAEQERDVATRESRFIGDACALVGGPSIHPFQLFRRSFFLRGSLQSLLSRPLIDSLFLEPQSDFEA